LITFTGPDAATDIDDLVALSEQYPGRIEFGILFSPDRQGEGRYPPLTFVEALFNKRLRLSAHICGGYSRAILSAGRAPAVERLLPHFWRCQINSADPLIDVAVIERWARGQRPEPILQCRESFPVDRRVSWLFDRSGGRGIEQNWWPLPPGPNDLVGYAGGISPYNVGDVVSRITNAAPAGCAYWLDMESGVRNERDEFDIAMCRAVCQVVYGQGNMRISG
jgi:hypothetical protein